MAPDPRSQEDNGGSVGSIIAGHRISLNVHYDPDAPPVKLTGGEVTPVEERVASTGALSCEPTATATEAAKLLAAETGENEAETELEKITHIDQLVMDNKGEADQDESLPSSAPSSSFSENRPDTPETSSAHSGSSETVETAAVAVESSEETPAEEPSTPTSSTASTSKPEMFKSPNKQTEYLNGPDQVIPSDQLKTWEPTGAVKLRMGDQGVAAHTPISVPSLVKKAAEKFPDLKALCVKKDGAWKSITYREYYDQIRTMAKAFIKLGLQQFHGVCILGFNSPEWFISDLAAIFAGGFAAGIYTTNTPEACQHCAVNCEAQVIIVEDAKQLDKIIKIRGNLPHLKAIIQYSGKPTVEGVISWQEAMAIGKQQPDSILEDRLRRISINQCCALIYTSGTTGAPKGVMLSHDNVTWTTHAMSVYAEFYPGKEVLISFLPLSHIAAQLADMYVGMYAGATVYFAQPDALKGSLGQTLKEVRPTVFLGVPRVWEKIYEKMMEVGKKTTGVKKSIATWAKSIGSETNKRKENKDFRKPFGFGIANAVVFKKIKAVLGFDRCRIFISAAAPISYDVIKYFHSLDITLTEIYGMSESTGPHTIGLEKSFKIGSTGACPPGFFTKLNECDLEGNGEICMGGRHVSMGYLRMEEKTHEAIDDEGWLHSGDIGKFDNEKFLYITGRLKELIITAGGENIPPVLIEDSLKSELSCISNCMLIGDKRKFLSILLTLKTNQGPEGEPLETLTPGAVEWCRSVGSRANTIQDILSGPDVNVMRAIQEGIDRANKAAASNAQRIQKWTILPRDFSIPGGELGPTMKLKRPYVVKKYSETIERFYEV